jgi:hypothetical protein
LHLWLDIDEATDRYPDKAQQLKTMVDRDTGGRGSLTVEQDREEQWGDFEQRRVRIIEFWERRTMAPYNKPAWYYCMFTGNIELESGVSPYLDENGMPDCPYVAWSPYVDERGDRYSPIRNMKSMQDEINHRRSKFLHMINVRQTHTRQGAVLDVDKMRSELARPDGVIEHNGEWGTTVGVVDQRDQVQGQAELLAQAQAALENLGPNPGLIGKGGGVADQSGRAILAQRDSGMTELSPVFERLRDWKLRCYRAMWARIKSTWTAERWIRVTDDERAPAFVGLNQFGMDPVSGQLTAENVIGQIDVDIILEEGPDTITMQEELLQTLGQMGEAATGPMGRVIIELSQINNKERLLSIMDKAMAPNPEIEALNAKMAELEAAMKAADVDVKRSNAQLNEARTVKELASVGLMPQVGINPLMIDDVMPMSYGAEAEQPPMGPPDDMMPADMQQPGMMPPPPMEGGAMPGGLPIDPALAG